MDQLFELLKAHDSITERLESETLNGGVVSAPIRAD